MVSVSLIALPEHILADLLSTWLLPSCLPVLDIAHCNRSSRTRYLAILRFEGTVFVGIPCAQTSSHAFSVDWALSRGVRVQSIVVSEAVEIQKTIAYLRFAARTLESLTIPKVSHEVSAILLRERLCYPRLKALNVHNYDAAAAPGLADLVCECRDTLQTLVLRNIITLGSFQQPHPLVNLQFLFLGNNLAGNNIAEVGRDLIERCPNLFRLFVPASDHVCPLLLAVAAHCPHLQQLHVGLHWQSHRLDAVVAVLRACGQLRMLEFLCPLSHGKEDIATVAAHCGSLTAFRAPSIGDAALALLLPQLRSLQHLALDGMITASPATLQILAAHSSRLRSLTLSSWCLPLPADAVLSLCRNLPFVEELCWSQSYARWITDDVLRAIGTHCQRLRYLSLGGSGVASYTSEGIIALLVGCPLLTEVCVNGAADISAEVRALRPGVTFGNKSKETCPFWRRPENNWQSLFQRK